MARRDRILPRALAGAAMIAATTATALWAHDFWIVPNAFSVDPGAEIVVRGQTSSRFPTSEAGVPPDRVAEAKVIGPAGTTAITDLRVEGRSLRLAHRPQGAGQRVVAVATRSRSVRESAASFRRYLELEGVPELEARYAREGRLPTDSTTRRYTKYAKTVVEVGRGGGRTYQQAAGHPVEFMPLQDPAQLRAGETLAIRLVYRGAPLAGVTVHGSGVPLEPGMSDSAAAAAAVEWHGTTDPQGIVRVPLQAAGLWNVRTLHIVPADLGPGADWDAHWASLVFEVGPVATSHAGHATASPVGGGTQADSAAVARAVNTFHQALSAGDSAAALALLAEDATILESGGVETRNEYRGHHLPGDIEFARAVPSRRGPLAVRIQGDVAWAVSTSVTQGTFRERAINAAGAELMVLRRTPAGWKIAAIHWSSRTRRP